MGEVEILGDEATWRYLHLEIAIFEGLEDFESKIFIYRSEEYIHCFHVEDGVQL